MSLTDPEVQVVQRRTLSVLVVSQALGGLGTTVGIAVAAVLAERVSGSESLAGMVQTMQVLGAALAAYLLARLAGVRGRRVSLALGYVIGGAGAALCVVGGTLGSFPLLMVGAVLLGSNSATNYQSRYAAADLAAPKHRARALSIVLWATSFGAVLGPNLVGPAGSLAVTVGLPRLTGPFLVSVAVTLVAAVVIVVRLRPDPLFVARRVAHVTGPDRRGTSWRRVRDVVAARPAVGAAVLAMSASHAVMVAVMVMTPLHMDHGGATLEIIGLVVSIHVLGMYFFAPVVGIVADRLGRPPTLLIGALVFWLSLALSGTSPMGASLRIGVGLFLLGLGWSICTVTASTLLTEATPIEDRTDVQGAADLVMNIAAAAGGALGGVVVDVLGFGSLNVFAAVLVVGVLVAALVARGSSGSAEGDRSVARASRG
jgi:MFS family permease